MLTIINTAPYSRSRESAFWAASSQVRAGRVSSIISVRRRLWNSAPAFWMISAPSSARLGCVAVQSTAVHPRPRTRNCTARSNRRMQFCGIACTSSKMITERCRRCIRRASVFSFLYNVFMKCTNEVRMMSESQRSARRVCALCSASSSITTLEWCSRIPS